MKKYILSLALLGALPSQAGFLPSRRSFAVMSALAGASFVAFKSFLNRVLAPQLQKEREEHWKKSRELLDKRNKNNFKKPLVVYACGYPDIPDIEGDPERFVSSKQDQDDLSVPFREQLEIIPAPSINVGGAADACALLDTLSIVIEKGCGDNLTILGHQRGGATIIRALHMMQFPERYTKELKRFKDNNQLDALKSLLKKSDKILVSPLLRIGDVFNKHRKSQHRHAVSPGQDIPWSVKNPIKATLLDGIRRNVMRTAAALWTRIPVTRNAQPMCCLEELNKEELNKIHDGIITKENPLYYTLSPIDRAVGNECDERLHNLSLCQNMAQAHLSKSLNDIQKGLDPFEMPPTDLLMEAVQVHKNLVQSRK